MDTPTIFRVIVENMFEDLTEILEMEVWGVGIGETGGNGKKITNVTWVDNIWITGRTRRW